jgi:nitrogen fixation protein NifB
MNLMQHPCFDPEARTKYARVHLPVATRCNAQCHYCDRSYSCANESRPGVTVKVLKPNQALTYVHRLQERITNLSVIGIAGPGDPFANPEETLTTLQLIRQAYPDLLLCVATNGLNLLPYIGDLAALRVSHITLTINAVDAAIGARIYAWLRYEGRCRTGAEAAQHLWEVQSAGITALKTNNIIVKINTILIPGINDEHIETIARTVAGYKADLMNIMPLFPVHGTLFGQLASPLAPVIAAAREQAGRYLAQLGHCTRCRADACGLLGKDDEYAFRLLAESEDTDTVDTVPGPLPDKIGQDCGSRPYVAVTSWDGLLINQHLGEAAQIAVYDPYRPNTPVAVRKAPPAGQGDKRWRQLSELLADCGLLLTAGAGNSPTRILTAQGIRLHIVEGLIGESLKRIANKESLQTLARRQAARCGASCGGNGMGCG